MRRLRLPREGEAMWYAFGGFAALIYIVLMIKLGVATIRNGHWVLFILGIPLPIFWIIGGVMRPDEMPAGARADEKTAPPRPQPLPEPDPREDRGRPLDGADRLARHPSLIASR